MLSLNPNSKSSRFSKRLDSLFWWLVKLLPLVLFVCAVYGFYRNGGTALWREFSSFMAGFTFLDSTNPIYTALYGVFGADGVFPIFSSGNALLQYLSYIVVIDILHIMVDVLVFIPRLAHKWIGKAVQDD